MEKWWEHFAWRQIQTNLREVDMSDIDAKQMVQDLQSFDATVLMLNVGGILASYETRLPFHYQSPFLTGDSLKTIIDACHAVGIQVVARTDFSKIRRPIFEQHPDWAYRTPDGQIVDYNGDVHACVCGGFQQEAAFDILREICAELPIDGLFINMSGFQTRDYSYHEYGICHCEACAKGFRAFAGMELPTRADMNDRAYRRYRAFQRKVVQEHQDRLVQMLRAINPQIAINGTDFFRMESNTEYGRALPHWQYSASSNTRCLRGIAGGRVVSNTSVDFIGFYYRHVAVSAAQQKLRLWQNLANLGNVDYYLIGRLDNHEDRSGYAAIREVFQFAQRHQDVYQGLRSCADVLLLRSHAWGEVSEERGWIRALTEQHLLFDEATEDELLNQPLDKYQAVIVAGLEVLSQEAAEKLDLFAQRGGTVIVSGNAARYDGEFEPYEHIPLRCLGIRRQLTYAQDMRSGMLHLRDEDHEVFQRFEQCDVVCFGDRYRYCEYENTAHKYMQMIPPHPYGPPERCYYTQKTDFPGAVVNAYGSGKGVYIPWDVGTVYHREGYENTLCFMQGVLEGISGLESIAPELSAMIETTQSINQDGTIVLVQLVNTSGHFGTSYFQPMPANDLRITVTVKGRAQGAIRLSNGLDVPFEQEKDRVTIMLDHLAEFEAIQLQLLPTP